MFSLNAYYGSMAAGGGGGGNIISKLEVVAETGSTVTCTKGDNTLTSIEESGKWTFYIPEEGVWTVQVEKGEITKTKAIKIKSDGLNFNIVKTNHYSTSGDSTISETIRNIDCDVGDLILVAIMSRSQISVPADMTLLSTSINTDYNQTLSWAYKRASSISESITITQASEARMMLTAMVFKNVSAVTDYGYVYFQKETYSVNIPAQKPVGYCVYGLSYAYTARGLSMTLRSDGVALTNLVPDSGTKRIDAFIDEGNGETLNLSGDLTFEHGKGIFGTVLLT